MTDRLDRNLDGLGWLELIGTSIALGAVLGLQVAQLVTTVRDEATPGPTAWSVAAAAATATVLVSMLLMAREWRTHGGRQVQRLGRRAWLTGHLPATLPSRIAVLRDLERRERKLQRSWLPTWVVAVLWTLLSVAHLTSQPGAAEAAAWAALLVLFLTMGATDLLDRRMRPRLRNLIDELHRHPLQAVSVEPGQGVPAPGPRDVL